ncbi:hypothetical protein MRB53_034399 [Persea americana]|uniref:Uncharacterized protein n=1 Tax=Persea americana TaxID=3435 RepID=A0ACC2K1H3_PERAE|nr:hypothetical protein MRB53_034399 [Persea americana]
MATPTGRIAIPYQNHLSRASNLEAVITCSRVCERSLKGLGEMERLARKESVCGPVEALPNHFLPRTHENKIPSIQNTGSWNTQTAGIATLNKQTREVIKQGQASTHGELIPPLTVRTGNISGITPMFPKLFQIPTIKPSFW